MRELREIQIIPTVIDKVHESCFRSYHILNHVLKMVERGDSKETIFEVVELLRESEIETTIVEPDKRFNPESVSLNYQKSKPIT